MLEKFSSSMGTRIVTALSLILFVVIGYFTLGKYFLTSLYYLIVQMAIIELYVPFFSKHKENKRNLITLLLIGTFVFQIALNFPKLIILLLFAVLSVQAVFLDKPNKILNEIKPYTNFILILFTLLALIRLQSFMNPEKLVNLFSLLVIAVLSDTIAYFAGTILKGKPMGLIVSPKKSVVGFVFALCMTPFVYKIMATYFPTLHLINFSILALFILTIVAILGDLIYSLGKREMNIKDYSDLMPGHGGVLDRLDSLFALIAVSFIFI